MADLKQDFTGVAQELGLHEKEDDAPISTFWGHLDGDELSHAIVDRFTQFRQWQNASGLLTGWRLKLHYYFSEYRASQDIPHLNLMQQWGAQGEFTFISVNVLRSLLKTILASVSQNPPAFQPMATNADADSMEAASLYQNVLDYYVRDLRLMSKLNKIVELALVVDQAFALVEWDYFASDGDTPTGSGIWKGAPSIKVLGPTDVAYDVTKSSWADNDYVIVRDWIDKEKCKAQFPEFAEEIEGRPLRAQIMSGGSELEGNSRYDLSSFATISNDIQVYKLFFREQPYMPGGRFVMCLDSGKLLFESPVGLMYPRLPVERFVPDDCLDILLGHSPINSLLGLQENVNLLVSAISTNAGNYANQYVAVQAGTELNAKTLSDGQKIIEFPPGGHPPQGINLTAIPDSLFKHLESLMQMMQEVPGISSASRGQAQGANATGSSMLFLASQTSQNQGGMAENYSEFTCNVMTSLLHVLRVFGRTEKTISIMGMNVASKTIVLADALKDFDEVVVSMSNPALNTPQGKLAFAQQLMQFGGATPAMALQVATSGNLGPAEDPSREAQFYLQSENEWLMNAETVAVMALDNHEQHIAMHTQLFATPWLRKPDLAQKLNIPNAPAIQQGIQAHIQQHMQYLSQNQTGSLQTAAPAQPGQQQRAPSAALGHTPMPQASPATGVNNPVQGQAVQDGTHLPNPPVQPSMPR